MVSALHTTQVEAFAGKYTAEGIAIYWPFNNTCVVVT
jgi:hypothetical protein